MIDPKKAKGFTLAELLIVVAIIAVLVSVSIPIFKSQVKRSREATCAANRRSIKAFIATAMMDESTDAGLTNGIHSLSEKQKEEYICPSGGTITYKVDTAENVVTVYCSEHAKMNALGDQIAMDQMLDILKSLSNIDSTATEGNNLNYKKAIAQFQKAGIILDGIKAWRYTNGFMYFSMEDVPQDKQTSMYVIQYNSNSHNYTVWKSDTKLNTGSNDPTKPYYGLGGSIGKPLNPNVADQTYQKALEVYQKAIGNG